MAMSGADVKVGLDILSQIFKTFKKRFQTKKERAIISNVYTELLMGDKADLIKIEAMLMQLKKFDSVNPDYVRANILYNNVRNAKSGKLVVIKSKSCIKTVAKKSVKPRSRAIIKKHETKFKGVKK